MHRKTLKLMSARRGIKYKGRVYAPYISLRSGYIELYSEINMFEYTRYKNNLSHIYRRCDPKANIEMIEMDVEGIPGLQADIQQFKKRYLETVYNKEAVAVLSPRMSIEPVYMMIGDSKIDTNRFSPYTMLAFGYEMRVGSIFGPLSKRDAADLAKASYEAETVHPDKYIVMDISQTIQYLSVQIPSTWLKDIVPRLLLRNQTLTDGFVYEEIVKEDCSCYCGCSTRIGCGVYNNSVQVIVDGAWQRLMDLIHRLYIKGSILLAATDSMFAKKWKLVEGKYIGVYHPINSNTMMTQAPTDYLLQAKLLQDVGREPFPFDDIHNLTDREVMTRCASPRHVKSYDEALRMQYAYYASGKGDIRKTFASFP